MISTNRERRVCEALAYAGFLLTGVVTTLLGVALPELSARWSLTDSQAGRLFSAQFAGSLAGVGLSGRAMGRFGFLGSLAGGYALIALGVGGLGAPSFALAALAVFVYGLGFGVSIPASNLLVAEINPERRAAALNLLNAAWCLGAIAGPPLLAALWRRLDLGGMLMAVALPAACIGAAALLTRRNAPEPRAEGGAGPPGGRSGQTRCCCSPAC